MLVLFHKVPDARVKTRQQVCGEMITMLTENQLIELVDLRESLVWGSVSISSAAVPLRAVLGTLLGVPIDPDVLVREDGCPGDGGWLRSCLLALCSALEKRLKFSPTCSASCQYSTRRVCLYTPRWY